MKNKTTAALTLAAPKKQDADPSAFRITLSLSGDTERQDDWNRAANREGKTMREWALGTLDQAAKTGGVR
ncbi:MAG: hypothetical protein ABIT37_08890 [Luteolibacter sp.]